MEQKRNEYVSNQSMVIGICGGSGSGKTFLTKALISEYKNLNPSVFQLDNYYLPKSEQLKDETGAINFDLPTALNIQQLSEDFQRLLNGETVITNRYTYNVTTSESAQIIVHPAPLIVVEGLFLFHFEALRKKLDLRIFINISPELQRNRRLERDQLERGYTATDIEHQWNNHVLPAYHSYISPYQQTADFIFNNTENWDENFYNLCQYINQQMTPTHV